MSPAPGGFEWFPFYVSRFVGSGRVRRMDATHVGAFLLLMCEQWEKGVVEDDPPELAVLCKCDEGVVRRVLGLAFDKTDDGWKNARLEHIRGEQINRASQASQAAKSRWAGADAMRTQCFREEEREVERETATTASSVARVVADFCLLTTASWKLKSGIPQWSEEILTEPKYVGADLLYEIRKCTDWHVGKNKIPKAPDQAIRNWLEKASKDHRPKATTNGSGRPASPMGSDAARAKGRVTHPVDE